MATEKQIPRLVGRFVEHQESFAVLSVEDTQWAMQHPQEAIALCVEAIKQRPKINNPKLLIEWISTTDIPATAEKFVASEKFVCDTSRKVAVKISFIGDNFKDQFLGKIEEPFGGSTLCHGKLCKASVDKPIIAELGGEEKSETTLVEIWSLMERQENGKEGTLITNGYANIFYVRDINGVLRAVRVYWYGDGWSVNANPVDASLRWGDGLQILSRNSLES